MESPSEVTAGRAADEEWLYLAGAGPSHWLVTIAGITFDRVEYDAGADVLYLHVGDPSTAVDFDETPEGHGPHFDAEGNLASITLVRPKQLLDEGGGLRITLPVPSDVPARELTPALSA